MYDYIIVGGAQSGLSMAYHLQKQNKKFIIVDGGDRVGASWLNRWDSLKLFTPTEFNHLPGIKFNAPKGHYPSKFEVAAYFKNYVSHYNFPIKLNTLITAIDKKEDIFHLHTENEVLQSQNVILATGPFHIPYTPPCHEKIASSIAQMHSNYYKGVHQLKNGDTLVVGGGDSGYQILDEISQDASRTVYFSGDTTVKTLPQQILGKTLWWWFTKIGFLHYNKYSWIGRVLSGVTQPVIGVDVKGILSRPNVKAVGRTKNAKNENIIFEHTTIASIKNVIWATGYRPNFTWIESLEIDHDGYPKNYRGVSLIKGLYFIGLPWLYTRGSATLGGVAKDAKYLAGIID